jgi:hypothetical protein
MGKKENGRTDGEPNAGDAVGDGSDPGKLRLVDGKVWAGRACETLGVQDHCAILWFERLGLDRAEGKYSEWEPWRIRRVCTVCE